MSAGIRAKNAKERARIAYRFIMGKQRSFGRAFDDCFEMGDGDDVYRELVKKSDRNPKFREALLRRGLGLWLEPYYRNKYGA